VKLDSCCPWQRQRASGCTLVVGAAAEAVKPERTAKIPLVTKTELHGQKSIFNVFYAPFN